MGFRASSLRGRRKTIASFRSGSAKWCGCLSFSIPNPFCISVPFHIWRWTIICIYQGQLSNFGKNLLQRFLAVLVLTRAQTTSFLRIELINCVLVSQCRCVLGLLHHLSILFFCILTVKLMFNNSQHSEFCTEKLAKPTNLKSFFQKDVALSWVAAMFVLFFFLMSVLGV